MKKDLVQLQGDIINWPRSALAGEYLGEHRLRWRRDGILVFSGESGEIFYEGTPEALDEKLAHRVGRRVDRRGHLVFPGLIDSHVHLTQLGAIGSDGYELLPWLEKFIFPLEKSLDSEKARSYAEVFLESMLSLGTTTAVTYGPAWADSTRACLEVAEGRGVRLFLGQTLMDRGSYRKFRGNPTEVLLRESEELISDWHQAAGGRLNIVLTPRFAITCTEELMRGVGQLSEKYGVGIQSHLSENKTEIETVLKMFPGKKTYTQVYDDFGCLNHKTIMAHCIHLSDSEKELFRERGAAIAYCPSSNLFLQSGILDLNELNGIKICMGSDIAGGTDLSMLETIKLSALAQKALGFSKPGHKLISNQTAYYLATAAAGRVLGQELGHLNRGAQADFFMINPADLDPLYGRFPEDIPGKIEDILSRLVYAGPRPLIRETWVAGRQVFKRTF